MKVIVCEHADISLNEVVSYIQTDSLFHAERVRFEILLLIDSLKTHPHRFQECPELPTVNHRYRKATYAGTYKIIYKIVKAEVWVLDVFHGKRSPVQLQKLRRVKP